MSNNFLQTISTPQTGMRTATKHIQYQNHLATSVYFYTAECFYLQHSFNDKNIITSACGGRLKRWRSDTYRPQPFAKHAWSASTTNSNKNISAARRGPSYLKVAVPSLRDSEGIVVKLLHVFTRSWVRIPAEVSGLLVWKVHLRPMVNETPQNRCRN